MDDETEGALDGEEKGASDGQSKRQTQALRPAAPASPPRHRTPGKGASDDQQARKGASDDEQERKGAMDDEAKGALHDEEEGASDGQSERHTQALQPAAPVSPHRHRTPAAGFEVEG